MKGYNGHFSVGCLFVVVVVCTCFIFYNEQVLILCSEENKHFCELRTHSIVQKKKWRPRRVKPFAQGHTARRGWLGQTHVCYLNPYTLWELKP